MALSVTDLFSIGIGPSSSHTVGPMRAGRSFAEELTAASLLSRVAAVRVELFGALGATGRGHGTDRAVLLGLIGQAPETIDPDAAVPLVDRMVSAGRLRLLDEHEISFDFAADVVLTPRVKLPAHPNGMTFSARDPDGELLLRRSYYSIGGGFVVSGDANDSDTVDQDDNSLRHHFTTGDELLRLCDDTGKSISQLVLENEQSWRTTEETRRVLLGIWTVMRECVQHGLKTEGILPGGLKVRRRAGDMFRRLLLEPDSTDPLRGMDWLALYALSVSEENAAGGRVVTAPTNGAAGIIPAVLYYYDRYIPGATNDGVIRFLLTAGAFGIILKENASISGAEVGCQGEVGSACAMAAAGMTAVLGGTPRQIENAAEIAMEHNLGLTCDPIGGLVQVPCIERNAIAAVKAVAAARAALYGDGYHIVSFDKVVETMRATGADMKDKYKETSLGGLAVSVTEC